MTGARRVSEGFELAGERRIQAARYRGSARKVFGAMTSLLLILTLPRAAFASPDDLTGSQVIDKSQKWTQEGTSLYSNIDQQWVEYEIDTTSGKLYVSVGNKGELPVPSDYKFEINAAVDGVSVGTMRIAPEMIGTLDVDKKVTARVRLTWMNDAWQQGAYDANLLIKAVWTQLPIISTGDPVELAKDRLRLAGYSDSDLMLIEIPDWVCGGGGDSGKAFVCTVVYR